MPSKEVAEYSVAKLKALLRAARPRTFDQVVELVAIAARGNPNSMSLTALARELTGFVWATLTQ